MKKQKLVGRYSHEMKGCHFEDIPAFLKMADLGEQNLQGSSVLLCRVTPCEGFVSKSRVLRWKIVKTKSNQLILALRVSKEEEKYPIMYRITWHEGIHSLVLKNETSIFSKFERLKIWYDSN